MKYFILSLLLVACLPAFSQKVFYKTDSFTIHSPGQTWENWEKSDIDIVIDYGKQIISVYSLEVQKFIYDDIRNKTFLGGNVFVFYCTNSQQLNCIIEMWRYNDMSMYMKIRYKNLEYKYRLIKGKMINETLSVDSI